MGYLGLGLIVVGFLIERFGSKDSKRKLGYGVGLAGLVIFLLGGIFS